MINMAPKWGKSFST